MTEHEYLAAFNRTFSRRPQLQSAQSLPGFWLVDGLRLRVMLDKRCCELLGVDQREGFFSFEEIASIYTTADVERFYQLLSPHSPSDLIIEELYLVRGRHAGQILTAHGSVMQRDSEGRAAFACGLMTRRTGLYSQLPLPSEAEAEGMWMWSAASSRLIFSPSYKRMLGYTPKEPFPSTVQDWLDKLVHPEDAKGTVGQQFLLMQRTDKGDEFECALRLKHKNGSYIWTLGRGMVVERDRSGRAVRVVGTNNELSSIAKSFAAAQQKIYLDGLTGLYNRSYFNDHLALWAQEYRKPISVIYIDLTGLKLINDHAGHHCGDLLLKDAAQLLRLTLRGDHIVVRMGGDEFLMLLPNCSDVQCSLLSRALQAAMEQHNQSSERLPVIFDFGCATFNEGQGDLTTVISSADLRMQRQKRLNHHRNLHTIKSALERLTGQPISLADERIE